MLSSLESNLAPSIATQPFSYLEETKALKTIERGFALTQERRAMEGATCCDLGLPRMISSAARRSPSLVPLSYSEALTRARQFPLSSSCATCVCVCATHRPRRVRIEVRRLFIQTPLSPLHSVLESISAASLVPLFLFLRLRIH